MKRLLTGKTIRRITLTLVPIVAFLIFNLSVHAAPSLPTQEVDGETCPTGTVHITVNEAVQHRNALCSTMGQWDIARLADGGSMDGPGYDCKVRGTDSRALGNALCKDLSIAVASGDAACPAGFTLATVTEAQSNQTQICSDDQVGPWYIMRLDDAGSMDGSGYDCKIRAEDTRGLGHSLCVEAL